MPRTHVRAARRACTGHCRPQKLASVCLPKTSAVRWGWSSTRNEAAVQRAFLPAFRCAQCYVAAAFSPRKTSATSHTQKPKASCNMPDPTHVICRAATLKAPSFRLRTDKPATYALRAKSTPCELHRLTAKPAGCRSISGALAHGSARPSCWASLHAMPWDIPAVFSPSFQRLGGM